VARTLSPAELPPGQSKYLRSGYLSPRERVQIETHASKWFYFPGPVFAILVFLVLDYAAAAAAFSILPGLPVLTRSIRGLPIHIFSGPTGAAVLLLIIFVVLTLVASYWCLSRFFDWASDVYVVTDDRLIEQTGIIRHEIREIPLAQVRNIDVDQASLVARVFRYGSLKINSLQTAQSGGHLLLEPHVLNPRAPEAEGAGVEQWIGIPDPLGIQERIEEVHAHLEPTRPDPKPPSR
jgi:Bacterial PH domain